MASRGRWPQAYYSQQTIKIFPKCDHTGILFQKLSALGINNGALAWIISNICASRCQVTEIKHESQYKISSVQSTKQSLTSGDPQGSIFDPIVFLHLYKWHKTGRELKFEDFVLKKLRETLRAYFSYILVQKHVIISLKKISKT